MVVDQIARAAVYEASHHVRAHLSCRRIALCCERQRWGSRYRAAGEPSSKPLVRESGRSRGPLRLQSLQTGFDGLDHALFAERHGPKTKLGILLA
jgi:hypothetical protein